MNVCKERCAIFELVSKSFLPLSFLHGEARLLTLVPGCSWLIRCDLNRSVAGGRWWWPVGQCGRGDAERVLRNRFVLPLTCLREPVVQSASAGEWFGTLIVCYLLVCWEGQAGVLSLWRAWPMANFTMVRRAGLQNGRADLPFL